MNEVAHVCEESKVDIALDIEEEEINGGDHHRHRADKTSLRELKSL